MHQRSELSHGYSRDIYHGRSGPGGHYRERDYGYDAGNFYPERHPAREASYEYEGGGRLADPYRYGGPEAEPGGPFETQELRGLGLSRNAAEPFRRPAAARPWTPGRGPEPLSGFPAGGGGREGVESYTWDVPGPYTGRGPKGYSRSDERIHEDVCERLSAHGAIDAREIELRVENGEVTLEGTVQDRRTKRLAEAIADTVRGVEDIHNRLRLRRHMEDRSEAEARPETETPH